MKRSCLLLPLLFGSLFGAAWYFFHTRFFPPADWIGALVFAFFTYLTIGLIQNAFRDSGDAGLIQRAGQPRRDGERIAVSGPIHPIGEPLLSPLSQTPCVAYEYELFHHERRTKTAGIQNFEDGGNQSKVVKDRTGLALIPSVVRSSYGDVKLLGYPTLNGFPASSNDEWRENAAQYLAKTQSEEDKITKAFSLVRELLTDDDGAIRKDWRLTDRTDFHQLELQEKVLEVGQVVTLIGPYSAEKNGIVQNLDLGQGGLRIIRGDHTAASASLRSGRVGGLIAAVLLLTIPNGILWLLLQRREQDNTQRGSNSIAVVRKNNFFEAVRQGDAAAVANYVSSGENVDATDDQGQTALMMVTDGAIAKALLEARANVNAADKHGMTPLMRAATAGNAAIVRLLIDSRASLDTEDPEYHRTAIQYAFDNDRSEVVPEVVMMLHDAGAHDDTPFAAVSGYFKAIHTGDAAKVRPFVMKANQHYWDEKPAWDAIQGAHPPDFHFDSGFADDGRAAVTVSGKTADGVNQTWLLQLVKEDRQWRVADEHLAGINK
ncbi:MAG TPA: ankyrin repeat domain-containing protein [Thermoanaerobaculia bacterium]|nr:ankyrin repeat domain-containing protein [Thermoanaerobaculia bacterium]